MRRFQEETTRQEKQCRCRDNHRIAGDVTRNQSADQHDVSIGGDQGGIKDDPEVEKAAV